MSSSRTDSSAALVDVTMPQMGVSVAEGTVVAWRVGVGDPIAADETICEISTDKIDTEVPAPIGGVVTEILVPIDSTVEVGTVLARIAAGGGSRPAAAPAGGGGAASRSPQTTPAAPPPKMHRNPVHLRTGLKTAPAPAAIRRSSSGSPPSTTSTSPGWPAAAATAGSASKTCWRSSRPTRSKRLRFTSRAHTGPSRRRHRRRGLPRRRHRRWGPPRRQPCHGCGARSAST